MITEMLKQRCIAIGGMPGTGKTTLMRKFLGELPEVKEFRKLVNGHEFDDLIILGDYSKVDEVFAGTDRFSMAVQPEAEKFFLENEKNVVFEGDRIFNSKMLNFIQNNGYELLVLILEASDETLKERYKKRGSDQSEKFISGRRTKCENIKNDTFLKCVYTMNVDILGEHVFLDDITMAMTDFLETGVVNGLFEKVEHSTLDDFFS